jgi:drug/metabolite transporter (DMT)-like permease
MFLPEKPSTTILLNILAMAFYGMSFISTKVALSGFGPVGLILVRLVVSTVFLTLLTGGRLWKVEHRDLPRFALVALFQPFLYFLTENYGLLSVSPAVAAVIIGTIPVVTPVFAAPILGERVRPVAALGLVVSFAGVAVMVLGSRAAADYTPVGLLLIALAVLAAVGYAMSVKRVPRRYSPATIVLWQNLFGGILFLPVFLATELGTGIPRDALLWAHVIFLAVFPSTLSFIFLGHAIRVLGPTKANAFVNAVPIFTAVFSFFILGEAFGPVKAAGMVIVIGGVAMAQTTRAKGSGPRLPAEPG